MKNKEKFAGTIEDIFYNQGDTFGIDKYGNVMSCKDLSCGNCELSSTKNGNAYKSCREMRVDWMNKEYVPTNPFDKEGCAPKLGELLRYIESVACNSTPCVRCKCYEERSCKAVLCINWLTDNGYIEWKKDVIR